MIIQGYELGEFLYESRGSIIYRATSIAEQTPCILKILKGDYPSNEQLDRFRKEYYTTEQFHVDEIIKPLGLYANGESLFIALEDFGGESLEKALGSKALDVATFLDIAIKITTALSHIHHQQIIHKDINPSNVVWNATTNQVKIIDFGISSRLSREAPALASPNRLEGTLSCMSPEQTGRMNRMLDYRTDLYSLGVTFYKLLTGRYPFQGEDGMELVHAHIAKSPVAPHRIGHSIPEAVSNCVLKLMAKNAEDRYQSTFGLLQDLERCQSELHSNGSISNFEVGQQDVSESFQIPEKLYGRQQDIDNLMEAYKRVCSGSVELMLVAGYSGIGKSAVVHEIHKPIAAQGGYFISGKCDQYKRNVPYESLIQAFKELVLQLLTESDSQIRAWKEKLLKSVGNNGQVIIDVIPEVELIIGPQPAVQVLPATESLNRFNYLFQNFVRTFAEQSHPLVMFLDDLQWADQPTLNLIEIFINDIDSKHILIIGAYRDNEVDESHRLTSMLTKMQQSGVDINCMTLQPLPLEWTNQLVADTLSTSCEQTAALAQLCQEKTEGNPFFLNQLLLSFYKKRLVTFNSLTGVWQWNMEAIRNTPISDNVVDLMVEKLKLLPPQTQNVMQLAAALSNQFDLKTLAIIYQQSSKATLSDLWDALQAGFIIPLDDEYKYINFDSPAIRDDQDDSFNHTRFRFLHDRVQQAAYNLIEQSRLASVHLNVATLLDTNLSSTQRDELFFEIVDHFNQAGHNGISAEEANRRAAYNLEAAKKAKVSSAYGPALEYINAGIKCLATECWRSDYNLALDFHLVKGEVEWLNAKWDDAIATFDTALAHVSDTLDRCKINSFKSTAYRMKNDLSAALDVGLEALNELGIQESKYPTQQELDDALANFYQNLANKTTEDFSLLPDLEDPYYLMVMDIYQTIVPPSYFLGSNLMFISGIRMTEISIKQGNSPLSSIGYMYLAALTLIEKKDFSNAKRFGELAIKLNEEKYQIKALEPVLKNMWGGHIAHYIDRLDKALETLQQGYQAGIDSGSHEWLGYNTVNHLSIAFWGPFTLGQSSSFNEQFIPTLKKVNRVILQCYYAVQASIHNLVNVQEDWDVLSSDIWPEREQVLQSCKDSGDSYTLLLEAQCHISLCNWFGDFVKGARYAEQAEPHLVSVTSIYLNLCFLFHQSMAYAGAYEHVDADKQALYLDKIAKTQQHFAALKQTNPLYNFFSWMLKAELSRIEKDRLNTMDNYDQAIKHALQSSFHQNTALACERAGKYFYEQGKQRVAQVYLQDAIHNYAKWGAAAKVKSLNEEYAEFFNAVLSLSVNPDSTLNSNNLTLTASRSANELDYASVLKASQTLSKEIVLRRLIQQLMKLLIENAGAEIGRLVLETVGKMTLVSETNVIHASPVALSQPIETSDDVPLAILHLVERTKKSIVVDNAAQSSQFSQDPYIVRTQPKSILCQPILHQGKLLGMIYLENNLNIGVFNTERLQLIELLASQVAISIENSRLYKDLEEKVQERTMLLENLQQVDKLKDQFLNNISHELRTPLNAIIGFSDVMLQECDASQDDEERKTYLKLISDSGQHLLGLVADILDFTAINERKLQLNKTQVDIKSLVDSVILEFSVQNTTKQITLHSKIDSYCPTVYGDQNRLYQVCLNLISNAMKFTERGEVTVDAQRQGSFLAISVSDTGIGIPLQDQKLIFNRFEQADGSKTRNYGGMGLGLSICKELVELHGGQISLKSSPGNGSVFTFTVPIDMNA